MTRWLTPAQQQAWRRFVAVLTLFPSAVDAQLQRDGDLTHFGYFVLAMLSETPGRALRMSELAQRSNSSPSRLSHMMTGLERRGWVRRERAEGDARGSFAVLTDAGYAKIVDVAPLHVEFVRSLTFDVLSEEQVEQLDQICGAILGRLDKDGSLTMWNRGLSEQSAC